jgi:hypothetical protein
MHPTASQHESHRELGGLSRLRARRVMPGVRCSRLVNGEDVLVLPASFIGSKFLGYIYASGTKSEG